MKAQDLIDLYESEKRIVGKQAYQHVSAILEKAKSQHQKEYLASPQAAEIRAAGGTPDAEQSWRAVKGKGVERLLEHIIYDEVKAMGLKLINGNVLEKRQNLREEESLVKRNLLVNYGELGCHFPDVDIIIYKANPVKLIAVISSKVTLRERVAHTGYWKLKLSNDDVTKHIKVYFVTLDEDGTLAKLPSSKGRAIVETDTDGCYVLSKKDFNPNEKVKDFSCFIKDLKQALAELAT